MTPGLVWLASFPKSGNTWLRILLSNVAAGVERPEDINDLSLRHGIASSVALFEAETLVEPGLLTADEVERLRPGVHDAFAAALAEPAWIKVHDAYTRLDDGAPVLGRAARAAVYLVRDPRDVAVSFAFHLGGDLAAALRLLNKPDSRVGGSPEQVRQRLNGWSGHVRSWLDQDDVPVLVVRYEDLRADTEGQFRRVLDFLRVPADAGVVRRAIAHADFAELQRQEREKGFRERVAGQSVFFRSGRVGDWQGHLDPDQVAAIEAAHGETMARLGYAPCG